MNMREPNGRFVKGQHYSKNTEFKNGQHWRSKKNYWDKDWLYNEYIVLDKSAKQIADESGCKENNILYFLKKHNIKTKTMSYIRSIKYWGLIGESNGMYGRSGSKNPNWKGGISGERQIFYNSEEWKIICKYVWKRDNYTCQKCKKEFDGDMLFHVHHIVGFNNKEKRADPDNLILLCEECHIWVHSKDNKELLYIEI